MKTTLGKTQITSRLFFSCLAVTVESTSRIPHISVLRASDLKKLISSRRPRASYMTVFSARSFSALGPRHRRALHTIHLLFCQRKLQQKPFAHHPLGHHPPLSVLRRFIQLPTIAGVIPAEDNDVLRVLASPSALARREARQGPYEREERLPTLLSR